MPAIIGSRAWPAPAVQNCWPIQEQSQKSSGPSVVAPLPYFIPFKALSRASSGGWE